MSLIQKRGSMSRWQPGESWTRHTFLRGRRREDGDICPAIHKEGTPLTAAKDGECAFACGSRRESGNDWSCAGSYCRLQALAFPEAGFVDAGLGRRTWLILQVEGDRHTGRNEHDWRTLRTSSQLQDVCHGLQRRLQSESRVAGRRKRNPRRAETRS